MRSYIRACALALALLVPTLAHAFDPQRMSRYPSPDLGRPTAGQIDLWGAINCAPGQSCPASGLGVKTPHANSILRTLADKLGERLSVKDFGAVGDNLPVSSGMKVDDGPAIQKAIDACSGCILEVPPGIYKIATPLTGKGGIRWRGQSSVGSNLHAAPGSGSILSNVQSGAAMITFPGSPDLIANDASAWSFESITLQGNNLPVPIVSAPEANPGRGSWSARFNNVLFDGGRPAISAANSWDWWIEGSSFQRCGDQATPLGTPLGANLNESCIKILNSAQNYTGANSNSWRITNNFFDITHGRAIVSDSSGAGGANQFMLISGNHAGPTGNEFLYGCFSQSAIVNNFSEGSTAGIPGNNLFVPGNRGGCGQNRIIGNLFTAAGTFHIIDGQAADLIADNTMQPEGTGGAFVNLTSGSFRTAVINNKTLTKVGDNSVPMVLDNGLASTIRGNAANDNQIANNEEMLKSDGVSLYGQLSPQTGLTAYTPTVSCATGAPGALGPVTGYFKQIGKLVYVAVKIVIAINGTCGGNLQFNLPIGPSMDAPLAGRETLGSALLSAGASAGVGTVYVTRYDAAYPGFNGATITVSGWYPG